MKFIIDAALDNTLPNIGVSQVCRVWTLGGTYHFLCRFYEGILDKIDVEAQIIWCCAH